MMCLPSLQDPRKVFRYFSVLSWDTMGFYGTSNTYLRKTAENCGYFQCGNCDGIFCYLLGVIRDNRRARSIPAAICSLYVLLISILASIGEQFLLRGARRPVSRVLSAKGGTIIPLGHALLHASRNQPERRSEMLPAILRQPAVPIRFCSR